MKSVSRISAWCHFLRGLFFLWPALLFIPSLSFAETPQGPIIVLKIEGTINPATADYLKEGMEYAAAKDSRLVILQLNTPGGLLSSMQQMVESLLQSKVPSVVFVGPQGAGAMSAGMFITIAGNFAAMAPGTTIGAAHPVLSGGGDLTGDMGQKIENFSVSLAKAIAEQRGRNTKWAEEAVRESVAATDREAKDERVIDFVASDFEHIFAEIEGKTINCAGKQVTLSGLAQAPQEVRPMSFKQNVLNYLADPNVAMLLGLGALLGLILEFYHPGAIVPGVFGSMCFVLALMAGQVLPISVGGIVLVGLGVVFCVAEAFVPSFGILGIAGTICVALGALYSIDERQVFSSSGFTVDKVSVFTATFLVASVLAYVGRMVFLARGRKVTTGKEGLSGKEAKVLVDFQPASHNQNILEGKVRVMGEIWRAKLSASNHDAPKRDDVLLIEKVEQDLTLLVTRRREQ